jgi:hypothetical protein
MASRTARSLKRKTSKPKARDTSAAPRRVRTAEREQVLDACELKLEVSEATPDEDLPAAEGGVA